MRLHRTNVPGRAEYTGVTVHKNPLLCSIAAIGFLIMYRFGVFKEPFPDMLTPREFYARPLLRTMTDVKQALCYNQDLALSKLAYGQVHLKYTHLGHGDGPRNMDNEGVPIGDIIRFIHYINDSQTQSYHTNQPMRTLVSRAGGAHDDTGSHLPG